MAFWEECKARTEEYARAARASAAPPPGVDLSSLSQVELDALQREVAEEQCRRRHDTPLPAAMADVRPLLAVSAGLHRVVKDVARNRTVEHQEVTAELALVKQQTKYMRLAGVTEEVLRAEPHALYYVADFGHGWSNGKELYCYFSPELFGGHNHDDGKLAWFVRPDQEKPSPQFDDHDHVNGVETYNWVSMPRKDIGWRVELAMDKAEIENQDLEINLRDPATNCVYSMDCTSYDRTIEYMYEDAQ
jgi:hypothetical protein